ncbi:hypothetical protein N0V84_010488 [Fusarium piperis]|uniref:PH domain-containing protein n=1 Tax=Fusarium piperis TaxID=1435070 RepID=A0A9W8TC64_9HYPO|nr:hypothetical protein N0V84_010488 [Fusarium piperis]
MAEEQKNVVVPEETKPETTGISAPTVETPAESKPAEETPAVAAESAPAAEDKPAEEAKPAEAEEAPKAEEKKEEVKPIEEGHLNHKAQGLSFPKNLIASKEFFWFGSEAVEPKALAHYLKVEKSADTAHSNIAWASETGKGLLFVGDKTTPSSVISLADATEPETDGSHKFHLTSKGNKHTFKAANAAERDNWVSQLKLKIAEAKELVATVTESETYKATVESFKPVVAKKEEKAAEAPKEEATPAAEEPAAEAAPVAEEAPKEEEAKDERKKEEVKSEEPKRRSASRKRTSFFGFGKKEESKKEEVKKEAEAKPAEDTAVAVETPAEEAPKTEEAPKIEEPAKPAETVEEPAKAVEETPAEAAPAAEEKPAESPKEKPTASKRNSFFGNVFSKKEKKTPELKPTEPAEAPKEGEAAETAPVIPPVEATTPLAVDVSSPATVPAETTEAAAATSPAPEAKKEIKEKRKSSLPFAFGKRDKSPAPGDGEKVKESPFSKLRNTIRGKSPKPAEKRAEEPKEAVKEEPAKEEEAKAEAPKEEEAAKPAEPEAENKPENATTPAPVVTAAA